MHSRARTASGTQDGYTLIELLMATALGLVITSAMSMLLISQLYAQNKTFNRMQTLQTLQTSLMRMTHEVRQAKVVAYVASDANLGITVTPPTGTAAVYNCSPTAKTCVRTVSGANTAVFATGVENSNIFTLECRTSTGELKELANPVSLTECKPGTGIDYVKIRLVTLVPCNGQGTTGTCRNGTIEVDGGTSLRNQA